MVGEQWRFQRGGLGDLLAPILVPILEFMLSVIAYVVKWPLWFIAKLLGLPSMILIDRDEARVGAERVRGWGKSQQRIQEIAESAAAGTLQPEYYPGYPSRNYRKVRNYRDSFWR
jgi:hypothetical protein